MTSCSFTILGWLNWFSILSSFSIRLYADFVGDKLLFFSFYVLITFIAKVPNYLSLAFFTLEKAPLPRFPCKVYTPTLLSFIENLETDVQVCGEPSDFKRLLSLSGILFLVLHSGDSSIVLRIWLIRFTYLLWLTLYTDFPWSWVHIKTQAPSWLSLNAF